MRERQSRHPGSKRISCQFYLTAKQLEAAQRALGDDSFSAFVAAAVLKEVEHRGIPLHGETRGGVCQREGDEYADRRCTSGQPAIWFNTWTRGWVCPVCAKDLNTLIDEKICRLEDK